MRKLLAATAVLLFFNGIYLFVRSGFGNTLLLNIGLFAGVALYYTFYDTFKNLKWLNFLIAAFAVLYMGLAAFAVMYGRQDTVTFNEEAAIVLGGGLRRDDVSPMLRSRLDAAVAFHNRNPEALIFVSGGYGHGEIISEAAAMAIYLTQNGVPRDMIILEDGSHSTYQNIRNTMIIFDEMFENPPAAVIITNEFHIYRAVWFARQAGLQDVTSMHGSTPLLSLPGMLVREAAAVVKMWVIGT